MRSILRRAASLPRPALRAQSSFTMAAVATPMLQASTTTIKEGQAEIVLASDKVFYNPVQEFNRDLSIAVLKIFCEEYKQQASQKAAAKNRGHNEDSSSTNNNKEIEFTILEALSATGLRSIRYAKEIPSVTKIIANDLSQQAVETIRANIVHNRVEHLVETSHDDASMLMYKHRRYQERFCAIDLDPYGCPSVFLDGAVQSVRDGGLLLVTATDMAVLAGNSPETCYSKYGAISLKTKSCHEMALRIMLQCIEQHANRYSRYVVPLLSVSADFYVRVFVKIYSGAVHCKKTTSKLSMVYHCVGCDHVTLQPLGGFKLNPTEKNPAQTKAFLPTVPPVSQNCVHCNEKHHMGGPIWSGPLHDQSFVQKLITHVEDNRHLFNTSSRIQGILSMVLEELVDVPLYYTIDKLFSRAHLETMPMLVFRSALLNAGYKVSYSHAAKNSIKTNAPGRVVWDILRVWAKSHPVKPERLESDQTAKFILSQAVSSTVDLSLRPDANPSSRRDGRLRFQYNPTPHWGPGTRASARVGEEKLLKSVQNQNKSSGRVSTKELKQLKREHSPPGDQDACKKTNTESATQLL